MRFSKTMLFVAAACFLLASSAGADWLVMKDGSRVEARDGWDIRGERVVFTSARGTLSMVRLSAVDMAATELANAPLATVGSAPAAIEEEGPRPVMVLTNADLPSVEREVEEAVAKVLPAVSDRQPVQVVEWTEHEMPGGGLELRGTVRNVGQNMASNITVRAGIEEPNGELVTEGTAFLGSDALLAGSTTSFRLMLPDVDTLIGSPIFSVESDAISLGKGRAKMAAVDPLPGDDDDVVPAPAGGGTLN